MGEYLSILIGSASLETPYAPRTINSPRRTFSSDIPHLPREFYEYGTSESLVEGYPGRRSQG
jgi:hypothetical protein